MPSVSLIRHSSDLLLASSFHATELQGINETGAKSAGLLGKPAAASPVALLLIDVINDLEYEGGETFLAQALPVAKRIATLKRRAKQRGIPIVYVNDNFGQWLSDFNRLIWHCLEDEVRGKPLAEWLAPDDDDYYVLKPKPSAFACTPLELLLDHLHVSALILTGFAGDRCVLATAQDAHLRGFRLIVPADCLASEHASDSAHALQQMETMLAADTTPSTELDLRLFEERDGGRGEDDSPPEPTVAVDEG